MTYETDELVELKPLDDTNEVGVGVPQAEAGAKPLWRQIEDLVEQTENLAHAEFNRDIAWMTKYLETNPSETMGDCLMRLTRTGLEFHDAETWWLNKIRESDYPAIQWYFKPGDTVGWAYDLLTRYRAEIVTWRLLLANAWGHRQLDMTDCAFIRELENPHVQIKLGPSAHLNDTLLRLTRKRRRLKVEIAMKCMLRRYRDASDRVLDTTFLLLSSSGFAFAEQETPATPGLSIRLPSGSSTHSVVEAIEGDARAAVTNLLDWAVAMDPGAVPQRDAYRLRSELERRARSTSSYLDPFDEVPF